VGARTKARKRALDLLFASEVRGRSAVEAMHEEQAAAAKGVEGARPVPDYTAVLVRGVEDHRERLDEILTGLSEGWSLARMPSVDRNVLRVSTYEILYVDEVPESVSISEALVLVRDLSTDDSPAFVNGVLAAVARRRDELLAG